VRADHETINRQSGTAVWVIGLVVSELLPSIPSARAPVFLGLAGVALIALLHGARSHRVISAVASAISFTLAVGEYNTGIKYRERRQKQLERIREYQRTNAPPVQHNWK